MTSVFMHSCDEDSDQQAIETVVPQNVFTRPLSSVAMSDLRSGLQKKVKIADCGKANFPLA